MAAMEQVQIDDIEKQIVKLRVALPICKRCMDPIWRRLCRGSIHS